MRKPTPSRRVGFLILLAITVGEATQVTGALLIFALLILPAATALQLTSRPYLGMALSSLLALIVTWVGLTLTFYTSYPATFLISALSCLCYALGIGGKRLAHRITAVREAKRMRTVISSD